MISSAVFIAFLRGGNVRLHRHALKIVTAPGAAFLRSRNMRKSRGVFPRALPDTVLSTDNTKTFSCLKKKLPALLDTGPDGEYHVYAYIYWAATAPREGERRRMISEDLLQSFIAEASDLLDDVEPSLVESPRLDDVEERRMRSVPIFVL